MSFGYALLVSLGICAFTAALEGVCAGKGVKALFSILRFPPYSAPLWVWSVIGGGYYLIFGFVIFRLLRLDTSTLASFALALVVFMMIANALWNYVFFRARKLFLAVVAGSLAPVFDAALFICLIKLDTLAAWSLVPYLIYRVYAVWWGYALWKVNCDVQH